MWPYPWTHVGTPSHLGHLDRVGATLPSQAPAGATSEASDPGQWEGQDVPLVRPSSCIVKGGIPSSRRYLPTYLIMRIEDLHNTRTFQVVPSRDCKSRNPDDKADNVWSIKRRNYAAHPRYCMYEGALIKNQSSLLVTLNYSAVPCEPQKTPLQTFATRLSRDDCFLLFKGSAGTMVRFWNEKPQASTLASSALPQDKWPLPDDSVRTPSDPCLVEVAAPTTESVHSVKILMGLLGPFLSIEKVVTTSNTATLFQIKYQARDSALLAHGFNYRGISARCLEPDHVSREKLLKPHTDDKQPNDLIAVFQCGGALGAAAFVTQLMDMQAKLKMPPPGSPRQSL